MSALEAIIKQKFRDFDSSKPQVLDLKQRTRELNDQIALLDKDTDEYNQVYNEIQQVKKQLNQADKTTAEEIDYIMQVGYLLFQMENDQEDERGAEKSEKDFYGCSVVIENKKGLAYRKYMADVENDSECREKLMHDYISTHRQDDCLHCGGVLISSRECTFCKACGVCSDTLIVDYTDVKNTITYEQQVHDVVTVYSYNRLNHLNEWLSKLQAREMTSIPSEVMDSLRLELKKARISSPADITQKKVKELLKKLKLSKYYEHVPNITNMLTGAEVPTFPPHLEDKLRHMFESIQEPFRLYCPKNRKNFLHYGYVLYKFCELLGEDRWLSYIPMLKSFEKLYVQDQIWKKICTHLKWEFIPSV